MEGVSWEFNEEGVPQLTDLIVNNPGGLSWAVLTYAMSELIDGGVSDRFRSYVTRAESASPTTTGNWIDPGYYRFDGSMQWPSAVTLRRRKAPNCAMGHGPDDICR